MARRLSPAQQLARIRKEQGITGRARPLTAADRKQALGKRYALEDVARVRKTAAQKQQRQRRRGLYEDEPSIIDLKRGHALKNGIESMARKASQYDPSITNDMLAKLEKMDASKLDQMYQNNELIFEVYFNYGKNADGSADLGSKATDINFLIRQYEQTYGRIE